MATLPMIDFAVKGNLYTFLQKDDTIANAEQLIATVGVTDKVPYQFRTSGGSADIGNRETDEIVGGSLVWNQIAPIIASTGWTAESGVTASYDGNTVTITSTTANNGILSTATPTIIKDHVYFVGITAKSGDSVIIQFGPPAVRGRVDNFSASVFTPVANIKKAASGSNARNGIYASPAYTNLIVKDYMVFDLTQMFGTTIADYIYSLETSTAGAGVAWFKKLFPKSYYPYQSVDMRHVSGVSAHRMVGFNQWDEEWESGAIDITTGEPSSNNYTIRSKNFCPCLPDTSYYGCALNSPSSFAILFYDANQDYIGYIATSNVRNKVFTTPSGARYFKLYFSSTTYNNDICLNLSWSGTHNGEYEPYEVHEYALDDSLTLRGIPKLDANNELYYDGDTYESDGTVTRRYGIVDLGTLTWVAEHESASGQFRSMGQNWAEIPKYRGNLICSNGYKDNKTHAYNNLGDGEMGVGNGPVSPIFRIHDTRYANATAAEFKAAMSGVYLVYELATPTTETAEPYTNPQIVDDWGTEEYVTDSIVPVGHTTTYPANLRDKLQHLPDLADNDGNFLIQQTGTQMVLVPFRIPQATGADGTYVLKATVSGGTPTYTWVLEE